jgi:diguanylate cyclase (GGDEF)-like protein
LTGRIIVFRDVSARKEVEKSLLHANEKLQTQLIEISLLQSQLREQVIRDPLTNLFNRRYFDETLERELARASREKYPLCIVMMDIDHFKKVNDTYGHEAGDTVLKTLGELVTRQCRQGDFVCRFGGEEFVLVMPNINVEVARTRAESILKAVRELTIPYGVFSLNVTLSMGISRYPGDSMAPRGLVRAADKALYTAKENGRNRVVLFCDLNESDPDTENHFR